MRTTRGQGLVCGHFWFLVVDYDEEAEPLVAAWRPGLTIWPRHAVDRARTQSSAEGGVLQLFGIGFVGRSVRAKCFCRLQRHMYTSHRTNGWGCQAGCQKSVSQDAPPRDEPSLALCLTPHHFGTARRADMGGFKDMRIGRGGSQYGVDSGCNRGFACPAPSRSTSDVAARVDSSPPP